jgi:hypothetical protein
MRSLPKLSAMLAAVGSAVLLGASAAAADAPGTIARV